MLRVGCPPLDSARGERWPREDPVRDERKCIILVCVCTLALVLSLPASAASRARYGGTLKIANGFRYYERNNTAPTVDDLTRNPTRK